MTTGGTLVSVTSNMSKDITPGAYYAPPGDLQHGIDHRGIRLRNLMVDPATDNLMVIDLGSARRRGSAGGTCVPPTALQPKALQQILSLPSFLQPLSEEKEKAAARDIKMERDPDVNAAITVLHGLVTRSPTDYTWESETGLWNGRGIDAIRSAATPRIAHPDVRLDSPVEAYHAILLEWLNRRRTDHVTATGRQRLLSFPGTCPSPEATRSACWITSLATRSQCQLSWL
ncbi:hypothetical protein B0T14DRAFT_224428 [Immersiella caudata]|uniref:Protein kinase domain-containing protein n=1 Tax=Immersiella caudata TaxID=314043 RepID=A0AA39WR98_9PEZI|nr:hypothetical protein B0T14DRAFT_224428 [Immersiella caudata]